MSISYMLGKIRTKFFGREAVSAATPIPSLITNSLTIDVDKKVITNTSTNSLSTEELQQANSLSIEQLQEVIELGGRIGLTKLRMAGNAKKLGSKTLEENYFAEALELNNKVGQLELLAKERKLSEQVHHCQRLF
jgi:hypothetical protein